MEFRLIYRGQLPAQGAGTGGSRVEEKHAIRRQLHPQLRELWNTHNSLKEFALALPVTKEIYAPGAATEKINAIDLMAQNYTKFGYRFIPLVSNRWGIACSLDILFLRRDAPGNLIQSGGDLDNRIKVLFDGLRVPKYNTECPDPPQEGENPFFCLLEDDTLITEVKITTDRLLVPLGKDEHVHDVHLILHVRTRIVDPQKAPFDFMS